VLTLVYHGRRRLTVEEAEPAPLGPGQARVRIHSVGLCKSDVYGYSGLNNRRDEVLGVGETLVMGHESVGFVEELGDGVSGLELGSAVAIDPIESCGSCALCAAGDTNLCESRRVYGCIPAAPGGYAESMVAPAANLCPLADRRPIEWGALVEPLTVGAHAVRLAGMRPGSAVLVVGGGIIGLGAALSAARKGAARVTVAEPLPERRAVAEQLGLAAAHPDEILGGGGRACDPFDLALDCVARPETIAASVHATGRKGTVMLVGIWADEVALPVSRVVENETRVMGSFAYSHDDFVEVAEWVSSTALDLSPIIQLRVGFDGVIDAFESYADGSLDAMRTLFQPDVGVAGGSA